MTHTTNLYFESHITIAPVIDEELANFKLIAEAQDFRVASLYMYKGKETGFVLSDLDCFCTGRSTDFETLYNNTKSLIKVLMKAGFTVRRYKIENTLVDDRMVHLK